jgi:hypothetical protein
MKLLFYNTLGHICSPTSFSERHGGRRNPRSFSTEILWLWWFPPAFRPATRQALSRDLAHGQITAVAAVPLLAIIEAKCLLTECGVCDDEICTPANGLESDPSPQQYWWRVSVLPAE